MLHWPGCCRYYAKMRYARHKMPVLTCGRCVDRVCSAIVATSSDRSPWPWYVLCDVCYGKWITHQFEPWELAYDKLRRNLKWLWNQGESEVHQRLRDLEEAGEYEEVYRKSDRGLE